jgi:hypothetical protein
MSYMKYIATNDGTFVIFSAKLNHKDIANKLGLQVTSAGQISTGYVQEPPLKCFGESTSLTMIPSKSDESMINRQIGWLD